MEGTGYSVWPFDLCAAGFGAPHIRQRLYFVADTAGVRRLQRRNPETIEVQGERPQRAGEYAEPEFSGEFQGRPEGLCRFGVAQGDTNDERPQGRRLSAERARKLFTGQAGVAGFWADADWLWCRDQKYRPVEPGTFPLADESPAPVGRLRGYGNALVAEQATEFIAAYRSSLSHLGELD
jgi:DNA (cytosine-5)-methyltransferase 1